jgi:hypothetical protein
MTACDMIVNTDQCDLNLEGTSLFGKCGVYGSECKESCSNITSGSAACNARRDDCFWLYTSNEGVEETGSCKDKKDVSLECDLVMDGEQCRTGLKGTALENDCLWLRGNASILETVSNGVCVKKVLLSSEWLNL